ncbi:hypothetical protein [Sinorhizobium sp. RAC02]|uniref:hypothetical protein n=1 Tax=Sinorhizobium sp. RAC02 TaxID=1842534 RepID=UPI0012378A8E|nr:hypothetical protein [Sinorhizobium sp. RAC02]
MTDKICQSVRQGLLTKALQTAIAAWIFLAFLSRNCVSLPGKDIARHAHARLNLWAEKQQYYNMRLKLSSFG